jgi:hypothetical protein
MPLWCQIQRVSITIKILKKRIELQECETTLCNEGLEETETNAIKVNIERGA